MVVKMKKTFSVLLAALFILCSVSMAFAEQNRIDRPARGGIGMSIMGFSTTDLTGNTTYTSDILQNADITVINFWATTCGPCCMELPYFQEAHEHYSATPETEVQIIGVINEDGTCTPPVAQQYLQEHGITYLNLRKDEILDAVFSTMAALPQTIIVDRDGVVREHKIAGFPSTAALEEYIDMWHDITCGHIGETCPITYINGQTNETICVVDAPYGYPLPKAPAAPEVEGYVFKKWIYEGEMYDSGNGDIVHIIIGPVTATAVYKPMNFKVRFYDGVTGGLIEVQHIDYGQPAIPPEHPEHNGWTFVGWDSDYSCIKCDIDIHGVCTPSGSDYIPGDYDGDGAVSVQDALMILRAAMNLVEANPASDVDGNGNVEVQDALLAMRSALNV